MEAQIEKEIKAWDNLLLQALYKVNDLIQRDAPAMQLEFSKEVAHRISKRIWKKFWTNTVV